MTTTTSRALGQYAWNTTTGAWSWDAGMYELHGYPAGAVPATTSLVLAHKHDDHRAHAAGLLEAVAGSDRRFSNFHSVVDAAGHLRTVVVVGASSTDHSSATLPQRWSRGFMVDVTEDDEVSTQRAVSQVRRSAAPIQQSMGLLMGSFGLTDEAAFAVIVRLSRHHNVKLRDLTERFMAVAVARAPHTPRELSLLLVEQAAAMAPQPVGQPQGRPSIRSAVARPGGSVRGR